VTAAAGAASICQICDVSDLDSPPGDEDRVADLAAEIRTATTFLYGGVHPDATVDAAGSSIVVKAPPHLQARVRNFLARRRAGVAWNGI